MFQSIHSLFFSKNPNKKWFRFLMLFAFILMIVLITKRFLKPNSLFSEGFSQDSPFITKRDGEVYDVFYSQVYDLIMEPQRSGDFIFKNVVRMTKPTNQSLFLDAGCGTGYLVNKLKEYGYSAIGVDKSKPMLEYAQNKYVDIHLVKGDLEDPMTFDRNKFSHVLCSHFTVYQVKDKVSFFRNCYFWLLPGGFFVVHLVDKNKFDPILQVGKPHMLESRDSPQKYANSRITDTAVDFNDFKYKAKYQFNDNEPIVILTEKFTDASTMNVRENEQTLYMNEMEDIIRDIQYSGFNLYDKLNMDDLNGDTNQYICVFQKPY